MPVGGYEDQAAEISRNPRDLTLTLPALPVIITSHIGKHLVKHLTISDNNPSMNMEEESSE